jgi:hypothetical protein
MNFPVTGIILVVLSVYFFFFAPRMLYLSSIFLLPFTAMAVVNIGWVGGEKGIAAWIFMAVLWMVRTAISPRPFRRQVGWRLTRKVRIELLLLLASGLISLLVPLVLNGTVWVEYFQLTSSRKIPLQLDMQRITATGYFVFGIIFTILVAVENCNPQRFLQSVRAYIVSAIFVSIWAFVQLGCILTGHEYPASLFNNSKGTSAQFYIEKLSALDLHRISSVATEPSKLAFSMLLAFILLVMAIGLRRPILSRRWDMAALMLVLGALMVSTSTTAYAGLVLASCLAVLVLARAGAVRWLYVFTAGGVAAAGVAIALTVPLIHKLVELVILHKAQGGSARERAHAVALGVHYFTQYPLFGISWNAANSSDLVFQMLSSLGIVGFAIFAAFVLGELQMLWQAPKRGSRWSVSLLAAVCLMLVLSQATGFPFAMGFVWFALGLGAAAPFIVSRPRAAAARVKGAYGATRGAGFGGPAPAAPPVC